MHRLRSSPLRGLATTLLGLSAEVLRFLKTAARSRSSLVAENLFLRKQLAFYQEHEEKPRRLTDATRIVLVFWSRWLDWKQALAIVQPEALIRWHRRGFKLFWRWKSKPGRPRLPRNIRDLIAQMAEQNPTWGQCRVASELSLKLGIYVSPRTVRAYWPSEPDRRCRRTSSQHWQTFVRNHARSIVASDFLVAVTARFRVLYVLVVMEVGTRRILHCNVTTHPTAAWSLQQAGHHRGNTRNGKSQKTLKGEFGELELETPRDRQATFDPKIVAKGQTRWTGFDDKIISMYARGMTTREIQGHLEEIYGIEVSPTLISNVTDAVIEEVKLWQGRPLEELYPIVYLDALMVKVRDEGHIQNKAIYVVLGVNLEGQKEVLGLWIAQSEGAKFWLQVLTELQNRGVKDILIACVDGLKGFPEAIEAIYPQTEVQLCIVHVVRASLNYVPWKMRKPVAADLQAIYRAATVAEAEHGLQELEAKWKAYPSVSQVWRRNWARITPFFHYPLDIRKAIYTTNSVESLNRSLRKIIKTRGGFPNEEAALKLLFLALRQAAKKWTMPIHHWREALNHFTILWPERMPALERAAS